MRLKLVCSSFGLVNKRVADVIITVLVTIVLFVQVESPWKLEVR